jgi:hypothetical protein
MKRTVTENIDCNLPNTNANGVPNSNSRVKPLGSVGELYTRFA